MQELLNHLECLELEPHDFSGYRVALKTQTSDRILWRSSNLKARAARENKVLNVSFPACLLRAQTYALEVSGIGADGKPENIGDYFFETCDNGRVYAQTIELSEVTDVTPSTSRLKNERL